MNAVLHQAHGAAPVPGNTQRPDRPRSPLRVAAVIPCYNEAAAIAQVVQAFRQQLPGIQVHVFDNASSDDTAAVARAAGATVTQVALRGKGNVVRRMFADVEADIYVMVDGDATYDLAGIEEMVDLLVADNLDMVVGARKDDRQDDATYRPGHRLGNHMLTSAVARLFGHGFTDMLSGYRVFSRRYVKSFPAMAAGFEMETELTVHALELRMPCAEWPVRYLARPDGSESKLSTWRDGWRIAKTITRLYVSERPRQFFTMVASLLMALSLVLVAPLVVTFAETGLVPRLPTAIFVTGTMLSALLSLVCGAVLRMVTIGRQEAKRLCYLAIPGVRSAAGSGA